MEMDKYEEEIKARKASIDLELKALRTIVKAVRPLTKDARTRVLDHVTAHLGLIDEPAE